MTLIAGSDYYRSTDTIVNYLQSSTSAAFGFVNSRNLATDLQGTVEGKVDTVNGLLADVLTIMGATDRKLKIATINIFVGNIVIPGMFPRVLISISAADMGVDHPNTQFVANFEFAEDLSTLAQQWGRA